MKGGERMTKKAMSDVVTTIVMIGLVLVAITIVWAILGNVFKSGEEQINANLKCQGIGLRVSELNCEGTSCTVKIERISGSEEMNGFIYVFSNETSSSKEFEEEGNIVTIKTISKETEVSNVQNVIVKPYLENNGEKAYCSQIKFK